MFAAYYRANDRTKALAYIRKLLTIYRQCGDTVKEFKLDIGLAHKRTSQMIYDEAKELYYRAIPVM